jgi:M6 family metalloprotease-like protein
MKKLILSLIFLVALFGATTQVAHAEVSPEEQLVFTVQSLSRELKNSLIFTALGANTQTFQSARSLVDIAQERKQAYMALMKIAPAEAVRIAFSAQDRQNLPKTIQPYIERDFSVEGSLEVIYEDYFDENKSILRYFVNTSDEKRYEFYVGSNIFAASSTVARVEGMELGQNIAVSIEQGGEVVIIQSASIQPPIQKKVAVILVNFVDDISEPFSSATVSTVMNGANVYYDENSFGKLSVAHDIFGYYTLPINKTCNIAAIKDAAIQAADADIFFPDYTNLMFAGDILCNGATGLGTVGEISNSTDDGNVIAGISWVAGMSTYVTSHELGHNFGLFHANFYHCDTEPLKEFGCNSVEYLDSFDVMGWRILHMNGYHKEQLGFFDSANVTEVAVSGPYTLSPIETSSVDTQVLKIPVDGSFLYVEYRQPIGFDSNISAGVFDGAMLHVAPLFASGGDSQLLDMTPTNPISQRDVTLEVGQSFTDPAGFATISVIGQTADALSIDIVLNPVFNQPPSLILLDPDITDDGLVNNDDVTLILSMIVQRGDFSYNVKRDLNADGAINILDAIILLYNSGLAWFPNNLEEGKRILFYITGQDPEQDLLTYSTSSLPLGATFNASTGMFTWIPGQGQAGVYNIIFTVSDGEFQDNIAVPITVVAP